MQYTYNTIEVMAHKVAPLRPWHSGFKTRKQLSGHGGKVALLWWGALEV